MTTNPRQSDTVCRSCGHLNPSGSSFCRVCGSALEVSSPAVEPTGRQECEPRPPAAPARHQLFPVENRAQPSSPPAIVVVLVAIALAAAGVAAVLLVHGSSAAHPRTGMGRATATTVTQTEPAASSEDAAEEEPTPVAGSQDPARTAPSDKGGWPGGFTVALASDTTRADAVSASARARAAGIPSVGIVQSSRYRSLTPGYWFVFSGVYRSAAVARTHVGPAVRAGFSDAYVRRMTK
jgi:hypothetical protein